jgi:hypothetical protein
MIGARLDPWSAWPMLRSGHWTRTMLVLVGEQTQNRIKIADFVRFCVCSARKAPAAIARARKGSARGSPGDLQPLDAVDEIRH